MFAVGISRAKQGTLDIVNHLGAKALAQIGLVGTAAAIASAVFHGPPSVIRDLPITPDELLA